MAIVFGGTNLGFLGYPKHTCSKPYKPYSFSGQYEVESYTHQYENFIECIKTYVENARNDISRIRESSNDAVSEANSL